jgi:regulator of sigma E protease
MNNWYLLAAVPVFGLLVLVHEFGHFISAKWAGIRVEEFGLGFPPSLVSFRKRDNGGWEVLWFGRGRDAENGNTQTPFGGTSGGVSTMETAVSDHTIYSLNLLPIGGFVRMPGENGDAHDESGRYDPQSFAAKSAGKRIIVLCAGVIMNFLLAIVLFSVAYTQGEPTFPAVVGTIEPGSPAQAAGLRTNDAITSVNGHPVKLFQDVVTLVNQAATAVKGHQQNVPIVLTVQRPDVSGTLSLTVNARVNPPANQGRMGVGEKVVFVSSPVWQAPFKGIAQTFDTTHLFIVAIGQMITGQIQGRLMGPVGVVQITGQVAQSTPDLGWWPILNLTAMLSLNLAIVNILPFPALDGGRILLILIEIVRGGKRLKPEREGIINLVGMALLLTLMVVITVSDVMHWGS